MILGRKKGSVNMLHARRSENAAPPKTRRSAIKTSSRRSGELKVHRVFCLCEVSAPKKAVLLEDRHQLDHAPFLADGRRPLAERILSQPLMSKAIAQLCGLKRFLVLLPICRGTKPPDQNKSRSANPFWLISAKAASVDEPPCGEMSLCRRGAWGIEVETLEFGNEDRSQVISPPFRTDDDRAGFGWIWFFLQVTEMKSKLGVVEDLFGWRLIRSCLPRNNRCFNALATRDDVHAFAAIEYRRE